MRTAMSTAALLAAIAVLGGGREAAAAEYRTAPVTIERSAHMTTVGGTVIPYKEVTLTAQIPGQVKLVAGREGDAVETGQVVVSINDDELQARKRAAEAALVAAEAGLRNAQVQYSRELWSPRTGQPTGMGLPSMMDKFMQPFSGQYSGGNDPNVRRYADLYGQAKGVDDARSAILQSRAQIEQLDAKIRDASLTAPFGGVIVKKMVEQGDTVQPGQPLMKIAYTAYLRIQAEVPVGLVSSLRIGEFLPARIDVGQGIPVQARVSQIFPMADTSDPPATSKFALPSALPGGPGSYAETMTPENGKNTAGSPAVPAEALVWRGSLPAVMVLKDGKPTLRVVRLGSPLNDGRISVLSGLNGGEQVILQAPGPSLAPPPQAMQSGRP